MVCNDAQLQSLTATEAELLSAILERIIPTDGSGAGAREANVLVYVDRALAGDLRDLYPAYAENLPAVDALALGTHAGRFVELAPELQDELLAQIEGGSAPGFSPSSDVFFELLRTHAAEGMFGDPLHGGNAEFVGWELIGFPGVKRVFTARDQELDVEVEPAWRRAEVG